MDKGIQIKGKSVEDAVELAAKELKTTKDNIEYTVLEESNKTLFSILSPRYAIIQAKVIDETKINKNTIKSEKVIKNSKDKIAYQTKVKNDKINRVLEMLESDPEMRKRYDELTTGVITSETSTNKSKKTK